jgi:hypothetical protein
MHVTNGVVHNTACHGNASSSCLDPGVASISQHSIRLLLPLALPGDVIAASNTMAIIISTMHDFMLLQEE